MAVISLTSMVIGVVGGAVVGGALLSLGFFANLAELERTKKQIVKLQVRVGQLEQQLAVRTLGKAATDGRL